ncbi:hypothetical protein EDM21_09975 [Paenibacillus sp. N10]|uniref:Uncharacterized protein n=1 Tax=Paenibacillus lutrae TaxID=2078573 RepID=A0A7X3JZB5_9BACL|nr:hypothetical protein [Paenibacillus lutrae]
MKPNIKYLIIWSCCHFQRTILRPVTSIFAQTNQNPVKEKAKTLAWKIVSDYGVSGIQYAIRDQSYFSLFDKKPVDPDPFGTMSTG